MDAETPLNQTAAEPRFELGARELWLLAGFLLAVIGAQLAFAGRSERYLVPPVAELNQLHLVAQAERPEPPEVLLLGTSRVQDGIHPNLLTAALSTDPDAPRDVVRMPIQGMRAQLLERVFEELIEPAPPTEVLAIGIEARLFYLPDFEVDEPLRWRVFGEWTDLLERDPRTWTEAQLAGVLCAPLRGVQAPWNLELIGAEDTQEYIDHLHAERGLPAWEFRPFSKRQWAISRALAAEREARVKALEDNPIPAEARGPALDPREVAAFERLLERFAELPCEVVFFRMPVLEEFDAEQARELAAYREQIVPLLEERGFRYADLNQIERLRHPDLFKNPSHVNPAGRVEASLELARRALGPWILERGLPEWTVDDLRERYERIGPAAVREGRSVPRPPQSDAEDTEVRAPGEGAAKSPDAGASTQGE